MMTESNGQKYHFKYIGGLNVKSRSESTRFYLRMTRDGTQISLSDFQGQKVLLWFYPRASTPG